MCAVASGEPLWRNPITGIVGCCARAGSGHAAAPPSRAMNSRRLMGKPPVLTPSNKLRLSRVAGVVRHNKIARPMTGLGHERLRGASRRSSNVRNAPLATVGPKRRPVVGHKATFRNGDALRRPPVCNSERLPNAAATKRMRRQFAEPRLVVAGKSSEVAEAERIRDRGHRSALPACLHQLSPRQLKPG